MGAKDLRKSKAELVQELTRLRTRLTRMEKRFSGTKEIRESLRETEAQYRNLIHNIPVGLFRNTPGPTGRFLMANPSLARMFGYQTVDDFLRCAVAELYQDPKQRKQFSEKLVAEGNVSGEELPLKRADGSVLWGAVSSRVVRDAAGEISYFDGMIEDITLRKQAEEKIRESEEKYRRLIEGVQGEYFLYRHDPAGVFTYLSPSLTHVLGYSQKEFSTHYTKYLTAGPINQDVEKFTGLSLRGIQQPPYEVEILHKDGRTRILEVLENPVLDPSGQVVAVEGIAHDITELKEAQKALKESERRLATLLANLPGMAYRCLNTPEWPMKFVSAGAETLTGYAPADLGEGGTVKYGDLIHPEDRDRVWEEIQQALAKPEAFRLEYRIQTAKGAWKWVWEQGQGVFGEDGQLVVLEGFISDISSRKSAEWERQQALDIMQDIFYVYNQEGKFIRWNKRLSEVSGYSDDEIAPMNPLEFFFEADRSRVGGAIGEVFQTGTVRRVEAPLKTKSGAGIPHEFTGSLLRDIQGNPLLSGTARDITERKRVEDELKDSRRRLADIIDFLPDATLAVDSEGRVTAWNRAIAAMTGIQPADILGKGNYEYALPFYRERRPILVDRVSRPLDEVEKNYRDVRREGEVLFAEGYAPHLKPGGMWFAASAAPLRDSEGQVVGAIETYRDITEHRKILEDLNDSQRRLEDIIAFLPDATMVIDSEGKVTGWNRAMEAMTGIKAADILGKGDYEHAIPFYGSRRPILIDLVLKPEATMEKEYAHLHWQGNTLTGQGHITNLGSGDLYFVGNATVLRDSAGKVVGAIETIQDVTVRRQYEEALRQSEERLRTITDTAQDAIIMMNDQGSISYWNPAAQANFGYTAAEALGQDLHLLLTPERYRDRFHRAFPHFRKTGQGPAIGKTLELEAIRKDGSEFPLEFSLSAIKIQENWHAVAILRDISARKAVERELQKAKEDAEAANRAKSTFLANMSHELRTPLNAIIGYSEMLRDEAEEQNLDDFIPDLEKIYGAGKHLHALINDILDLSKIEAGKVELFIEPFSLEPMIQEVLSTVHPLVVKNHNSLQSRLSPNLGIMAADMTRVRQILFNLISNAGKFTENGAISFEVSRDTRDGKDWIQFVVRDTGIGMSPEQQVRVFQGFTQADASTTKKYGGTGLGLPISQKFCQMMGGEISVESQLGKGATFTVMLPAQVEKSKPAREGATPPAAIRPAAATAPGVLPHTPNTVVVIDDDPTVHDLLARYLEKEGFEIISAETGRKGIQLAKQAGPVAIILDVLMPGMDGWAVLRELKSDPQLTRIPVIMITIEEKQQLGFSLGASDYLIKPVDPDRLVATLAKYKRKDVPGLVLVVDDDQPDRDLMVMTIKKQGWYVSEAENGRIALARVDEHLPDLIFLDLMMPEMDGFEFMRQLRLQESCKLIPVVVVTAKDLTEAEQQQLRGNVQRIFRKGEYSRNQLLEVIREQLRGHASPGPLAGTEAESE